jgi:maltose alpha-D-glucosyltransferase/alpha-amylase
MRRECPEISWGTWKILDPGVAGVLVMRYDWAEHTLVILHNFTPKTRVARLAVSVVGDRTLTDLLATDDSHADENGRHAVQLEPYGYRWFRARGTDRNVPRESEDELSSR